MLAGRKALLKKADVRRVQVPQYDELSVRNIYPMFKTDPELQQYLPDKYPAGKGPPRQYFFDVLNTLYPEYLAEVMQHACQERMSVAGDAQKLESIQISQFWEEELKSMPYLSCKFFSFWLILTYLFHLQRRTGRRCTCSRPPPRRSRRAGSARR